MSTPDATAVVSLSILDTTVENHLKCVNSLMPGICRAARIRCRHGVTIKQGLGPCKYRISFPALERTLGVEGPAIGGRGCFVSSR